MFLRFPYFTVFFGVFLAIGLFFLGQLWAGSPMATILFLSLMSAIYIPIIICASIQATKGTRRVRESAFRVSTEILLGSVAGAITGMSPFIWPVARWIWGAAIALLVLYNLADWLWRRCRARGTAQCMI